ncbi:unnamed protein product [Symbiodinium pilosum]|uniref:Uncharacterized protein n=1 Tax=Symbiodinium pilosum TaxID=2952 RepID=A0A812X8T5_SYMPI|nr:unnamed protein product [Symbiodinium pilosum]
MKQLLPVLLCLACHIGTSHKFKGDPTSDQEWTDLDIASEGPDPIKEYGPHADLSMALSLVLTNLSNYSGLINSRDRPHNANLTYYFGVDPHQDLLMPMTRSRGSLRSFTRCWVRTPHATAHSMQRYTSRVALILPCAWSLVTFPNTCQRKPMLLFWSR